MIRIMELPNDEVSSRMPGWFARQQVEALSEENVKNFSNAQLKKADRFETQVEQVFYLSPIYRNYRKNWIAIKVDHPVSYKPAVEEITALDALALEQNIQIVKTQSAVRIYRIPLK